MKTSRMNLMLSASALALALALAGCGGGGGSASAPGGGGGGGTNPSTDTGGDMPMMTDQEKLAAAYMEWMEARDAVLELEEDASDEDRSAALLSENKAQMAYAAAWALDGNAKDRADAKLRADAIGPDGTLLTDSARTDAFTVKAGTLTEVSEPAVKFEINPMFSPLDIGDRYSGGALWRRQLADGSSQWVIPRTDKEADKPAKFSEYYGTSGEPSASVTGDAGFKWKAWAPGVSSDGSVITIASNADANTFKLFDFDFTMDEDDGDGMKFAGSFHGIPGDLACASGCTEPTFNANGMITSIGGTWTFTPTATGMALAEVTVADVKEDAEYLDFGSWGRSSFEGGEMRDFGTYYKVSEMGTSLTFLEGEAEYKGMAAGTYAKKTENPERMLEPTSHGAFTATVALTAKFAGGAVPMNDHNMISGSITGFMDGEGNAIDETWAVTLERAAIADDGAITGGMTKTTGDTGTWQGAFLGGDGTGNVATQVMPSAVTGTFGAHFTNGDVVGAFGAHHQKPAQ